MYLTITTVTAAPFYAHKIGNEQHNVKLIIARARRTRAGSECYKQFLTDSTVEEAIIFFPFALALSCDSANSTCSGIGNVVDGFIHDETDSAHLEFSHKTRIFGCLKLKFAM